MGLLLVTPSVGPVISDSIAKLHCSVDSDDDIALVQLYRDAAENDIQTYLRRALLNSTWDFTLDDFPIDPLGFRKGEIVPPLMPFTGVVSLKYFDSEGTEQTMSGTLYQIDISSKPGRVTPAPSTSWPTVQSGKTNAVVLRFNAGYIDANNVPASIKSAILLRLRTLYDFRSDQVVSTQVLPLGRVLEQMLSPYINRWHT